MDRIAHASRVLALASRQRGLSPRYAEEKFVLARRQKSARDACATQNPPEAPIALSNQRFTWTLLSCCSVAQGALRGASVTASLGFTNSFSIRYCSTSSPLTSASIFSLISMQGESG